MNETCGFYLCIYFASIQKENTIFDFSCLRKTWFKSYFYDSRGMGETGACEQRLHIQEHLDSEDVAEMFILLHFFFYMKLALILCS